MNKNIIDESIPYAYEALKNRIAKNNQICKTYRGYISSFGAAITMGSLLSAVAFFSTEKSEKENNKSSVSRKKVIEVVLDVLKKRNSNIKENRLYDYVINAKDEMIVKEEIINAAIAVKLAMNLFELVKEEGSNGK